jgi:hypothetical protein
MKHIQPPHKFSRTDWQRLGELEILSDSEIERAVQAWLNKTLGPLGLHSDLLDRILRSACEAATRALQLENSSMGFWHVHLLAFSSHNGETKRQTWGFFRLEKLEAATGANSPNHAIEFYLYLERQSDLKIDAGENSTP